MHNYIFEVQDLGVHNVDTCPLGDHKVGYQHSLGVGPSPRKAVQVALSIVFEGEEYQEAERLVDMEQFDDTHSSLPFAHFALLRYRSPIMMHCGVAVDLTKPTTGVLLAYGAEWLHECTDEGIDLDWEEHLSKCENEDHDTCGPEQIGTVLIGFTQKDDKWMPDPEAEFSAIVGDTYCQVIRSRWFSRCALCSPCYPGQADLDTKGEIIAYTLPADVWGNNEHLPIEPWWKEED